MAELLQLLTAAKTLSDQATNDNFIRALNQHARLLDQQTGLVNHQAAEVQSLVKATDSHADAIEHMQAYLQRSSTVHVVTFTGLLLLTAVLAAAVAVLYRRVRKLESIATRVSPVS